MNENEPLPETTRIIARGLHGILNEWVKGMQKYGHKSPSSLALSAFLAVAQEEGLSVTEYAKRVGVPKSTMSTHLLEIGDRNRKKEKGVGLVTSRANPSNRREREYMLTPRGRDLAEKIRQAEEHINCQVREAEAHGKG